MNSKYYTPEIEEFYVGFEYEIFEDFDFYPEKTWHKFSFTYKDVEKMNFPLPVDTKVRVKYLDKEGIESLGFTLVENVNGFSTFKKGEHILRLFIKDSNEYTIEDPGNIVFQGIIKNKSELKKLLKQLNIK